MKEKLYRQRRFPIDPSTFGGLIYPSDFNTERSLKERTDTTSIARRIVSDQKFDEQCKRNSQNRDCRMKDLFLSSENISNKNN